MRKCIRVESDPIAAERRDARRVCFRQSELDRINVLAKKLKSTPADTVMRCVDVMEKKLDEELENKPELAMRGDEETVRRKGEALVVFSAMGNNSAAASHVGVTSSTIQHWLETDPVFHQLAQDSRARAVSKAKMKLYALAMGGNISALFGILNNEDPEFGQVRTQMIELYSRKFKEHVLECAKRTLPKDQMMAFADAVDSKPIDSFFGRLK